MDDFLYHYEARLVSVYDGDTIRVDLSLGFNIWQLNKPIRLYGIDTPELRGAERPQGLVVRDIVEQRLRQADRLIIETHKDTTGKYGRLLGTVHYRVGDQWRNLNQELLEEGLAAAYPE
jgi:micrococcal nuclease